MANRELLSLAKATFAVAAWGASFIATKIALQELHPLMVIWTRFGIGVILLGGVVVHRHEWRGVSVRDLLYFGALGFLGITLHQWLQATGLLTTQASTTAWIISSIPVFIALLGWVFLRERPTLLAVGGIGLAAVGVLVVVSGGDLHAFAGGNAISRGEFLILLSAPNWALFSVLSRYGLRRHSATRMMFFVMTFGWLWTTLGFALREDTVLPPGGIHLTAAGWTSIGFLGIVCTGIAYVFWYDALKFVSASRVGSLLYLEPLVAVVVAAVLLEEPILLSSLTGGVLILSGVWLVNRHAFRRGPS
jgi:drug/metabolite transporter (DMT)-like permease